MHGAVAEAGGGNHVEELEEKPPERGAKGGNGACGRWPRLFSSSCCS